MSTTHIEGPLLRRSIPFVERWIAELVAAREPPASANNSNNNNNNNKTKTAVANVSGKVSSKKGEKAAPDSAATSMSRCHFVIGKVLDVRPHPESQKLYIEEIDIGEPDRRRTILSGLQEHVQKDDFVNRLVLVIANLEPRKIGGVLSEGMVLCAATAAENAETRSVVLLDVPHNTPVGERVTFAGHEGAFEPVLKKKLAKHFEEVAAGLKTNEKGEVVWNGMPFRTSKGVISASIPNGTVS